MTIQKAPTNNIKKLRIRYDELKTQMSKLINHAESETWKKYLILSEANLIAKKLHQKAFSIRQLAHDFNMSSTNVYEILSLDKMTVKSKQLLKENKISAAKMAMICSTKNVEFQDEIVDMVVKKKLTVHDIHSLKPRTREDISKFKLDRGVKLGFARKEVAFASFTNLIDRFNIFLQAQIEAFPENKVQTMKLQLEDLKKKIDLFIVKIK